MSENNDAAPEPVQNPRITWEGCSVLLDVNDGDRMVFARLTAGSTLKIGNKNCSLKPLIGCPFGSSFQLENGTAGPYLSRIVNGSDSREKADCEMVDEGRDNRSLIDNNKAQSLSGEDIDAMKRQGAKGDEIIDALIANSATFDKKTAFSQEKYRIKKQKKYAPRVILRRPFSRSICEAYFKKHPAKIGFIRVDTLSLVLSMANVGANSDVLVVDRVGGLVTGAVAERLGGSGHVCNAYFGGSETSMDIVRIFNFSNETCKRDLPGNYENLSSSEKLWGPLRKLLSLDFVNMFVAIIKIVRAPLSDLASVETIISSETSQHENTPSEESNGQTSSVSTVDASLTSVSEGGNIDAEATIFSMAKAGKATKAGEKASPETLTIWKESGFSSLIIAAPDMDPWSLVKDFLPLLSFSAPFAIYHQYLQPLATCMHNLQISKMAIGLQISEPWLREYQVLPSRTHPMMQMSTFGGYILSGTRIHVS